MFGSLPALFAACCFAQVAPPDLLAFHASFDGTLNAAPRVAPVKVVGTPEYRPGRAGQALVCGDGATLVHYPSAGVLRPSSGTVEMWVCPLNWTGEEDEFHVFFEAQDPAWLVLYRYYQGGILTLMGANGTTYKAAAGPPIRWRPNEWHHMVGTWRGRRLAVYVDGALAGSTEHTFAIDKLAGTFRVGDEPWHIARTRRSLIDEVKVYSVALEPEDVARVYKGEVPQYRTQLPIDLSVEPVKQTLRVVCNASGSVGELGPGRSARVEMLAPGVVAPIAKTEIAAFEGDEGACAIPLTGVPAGQYSIRVTVIDSDGARIAQGTAPFAVPAPPVWRGTNLGAADKVLAPWTPLKSSAARPIVECWGRRYVLDSLLGQTRSAGAELLASPVSLEAVIAGKVEALTAARCRRSSGSPTQAQFAGSGEAAGLRVSVKHRVDFDGFIWTDLTVDPTRPVRLDELRLTWTMPRACATLMHADCLKWAANPAGALPASGWTSEFTHFLWLGNEDVGLSWFAETDRNWRHVKSRPAIEVRPEGDVVRVTVRLIAEPLDLTTKRDYGFGMMATPVRPQPKDARKWRMTPSARATFDIVWPNGNMKWYGYPEPTDPRKFALYVKEKHSQGCKVVPYVNLNFLSSGAPEWRFYGGQWGDPDRVVNPEDVAQMGFASMGVCPAVRDWQDFIVYRVGEMIDRYGIDGIYIDCWGPTPCRAGTCGWKGDDGVEHGTRPIRAYREILRRVYALFREKRIDPLIMVHMSSEVVIPMLSFADAILDGEQFGGGALRDDYLDLLPPDKFRAEFMGRNYGPVSFFLPKLREPNVARATPNLAAYLMLHDVNPWPIWSEASRWNRMYDALDMVRFADGTFQPYWDKSAAAAPPQVLASTYTAARGAVVAVMNTGEKIDARVKLDLARLELRRAGFAMDALTGDVLKLEGDTVLVPLARRQGRVIVVRP